MADRHRAAAEQLLQAHRELRAELARVRDHPGPLSKTLRTHCLSFCANLHTHHTREDGAFTRFEAEFPELAPAFARFRREHQVVQATLAEIERLLASRNDVRAELDKLSGRLEEHFAYEERQLIPALLA